MFHLMCVFIIFECTAFYWKKTSSACCKSSGVNGMQHPISGSTQAHCAVDI